MENSSDLGFIDSQIITETDTSSAIEREINILLSSPRQSTIGMKSSIGWLNKYIMCDLKFITYQWKQTKTELLYDLILNVIWPFDWDNIKLGKVLLIDISSDFSIERFTNKLEGRKGMIDSLSQKDTNI